MWPLRSKASRPPLDGKGAERLARQYLISQKLNIVTTNYRIPRGEIDIIARELNTLVFVEVRLRSHNTFGSAAESVDYKKQARLIAAAESYLQQHPLTGDISCRFDVIAISANGDKSATFQSGYQVEWLKNAFSA